MRTIEVNLLPSEYAPESPYSLRSISFLVLSFLILIFLTLNSHKVIDREKALNLRSQGILRKIDHFRQVKSNSEKLRERTTLLYERRDHLAEVINRRTTWSDKLGQIYTRIPAGMWLSEISIEREEVIPLPTEGVPDRSNHTAEEETSEEQSEQIILYILGDAKDLSRITEFISRLETLSFLANPQLHSIDKDPKVGRSTMSFEITAQVNVEGDNQ